MSDTASPPVEVGWAELERGAWSDAAACFDAALAARPDDSRALEGRAWAAWWLSDADTLFSVRERAFEAFRSRGELRDAARTAIWIGCDHHDFRGEHAIASGWYQRARRLLEDIPTSAEHAWLAFHEGAYAIELADDTVTAKQRAEQVITIARSLGLSDLVYLGLALEGLALVTEGAVDEGMRSLDEASLAATSGGFQDRIPRTWILCYMIYACERVRDFDRTAQWCRKMEQVAARFGADLAVGVCRAHYGGVLVFHGEWERAEHELQEAGATLARARPPVVAESDARLGELRRRQGRFDEAIELFRRAGSHPLAVLGLASVTIDRGDPAEAVDRLGDLVDATPRGSITQLADAHHLLTLAHARLGNLDAAAAAASALDLIARTTDSRPLSAMAAEAHGAVASATGDDALARRCYEQAADVFESSGLPYEAACARGELSAVLARLGRHDAATIEAGAASHRLRELGATHDVARIEERRHATSGPGASPALGLTPREREVVAALSEGMTDREIAVHLSISAHTVHRHVSNILAKLGVRSRAAAASLVGRHGVGT